MAAVTETLLHTKTTSLFLLTVVQLTLFHSRVSEVPTCCFYVGLTLLSEHFSSYDAENFSHHMTEHLS